MSPLLLLLALAGPSSAADKDAKLPSVPVLTAPLAPVRSPELKLDASALAAIPRLAPLGSLPQASPAAAAQARPPQMAAAPRAAVSAQAPQASAAAAAASAKAGAAVAASIGDVSDGAKLFDGGGAYSVGSFEQGETLAPAPGLWRKIKRGLKRAGALDDTILPLYDDNSRKHYYHGLSIGTLEKAVDSGGLAAKATYVSDEAGYPYSYARGSSRRTGTPGVVLQFEMDALEPLIVQGHYNPRAPAPGEKWEEVPHWFMAVKTIPLSAQTELSKKTVLEWLAAQRDAHPDDLTWDAKIAKFEAAFGAKAPAAKPKPVAPPTPEGRLGLDGLKRDGKDRWAKGDMVLKRLGQGSVGFVDVHPARPGLIVKTISPSLDLLMGGLSVDVAIKEDERSAIALAEAGIGPRFLGAATIDGRRVSVRERVFGKTMRDLIEDRAFGAEEEALVLDMARRMAAKNLLVSDLKPENIMIGTTERDGTRKAWFVDGGVVESFQPGLTEQQRYDRILDYGNVIGMRQDYNTRQIEETVRTLRFFIQEGREESAMPRWRLFLKKLFAAFMQGGMAAANK